MLLYVPDRILVSLVLSRPPETDALTSKFFLARAHGIHGDVGQGVNALVGTHGQRSVHQKAIRRVLGVRVEVPSRATPGRVRRRFAGPVLVHPIILSVIGKRNHPLRQCVTGIPVGREGRAAVEDELGLVGRRTIGGEAVARFGHRVLGQAAVLIQPDSAALPSVGRLLAQVFGIRGAKHIWPRSANPAGESPPPG